ncbi:MAG: response regulator [Nitrospira sp.]|nr:MAG: response regulator [Nitrospira sp.]
METTILIVDDAPDSWNLLSSIVRAQHFHPIWAADGLQAISKAREHQPHVILLDLGLPGGNGFVILERLKQNQLLSAIPVIVVTAQAPAVAEQRARKSGAIAFFQKPVKADELISTIRGVLGKQESSCEQADRMAGVGMRKNQRLKKLAPVRYRGDGIAGEGMVEDLSLSGSYINGNTSVVVGMALALQMFVPGDPEPLLIDRATVKWVKGSEFGVDFDTPQPQVTERITTIISMLVKSQRGPSRGGGVREASRYIAPHNFWTGRLRSRITRSKLPERQAVCEGLREVGDAEGHQPHWYRVNLYYRFETFRETATYTGQELASPSVLLTPSCLSRPPF